VLAIKESSGLNPFCSRNIPLLWVVIQGWRKQLRVGQANFTFHRRRKIACKAHSACEAYFLGGVWGHVPQENLKQVDVFPYLKTRRLCAIIL